MNETYRQWWETTWADREKLLRSTFGETDPAGSVTAFEWLDIDVRIPGACALTFPPTERTDGHWLTVTHGLTQPSERSIGKDLVRASGYGYEYGIVTDSRRSWAIGALWQLLTYLRQRNADVGRGHRIPVWFKTNEELVLGKPQDEAPCIGYMRAWLFWPHMKYPGGFNCSTGYFSVLVATLITHEEWQLAKDASSAHMLLMLYKAGIGQISDPLRASITTKPWFDSLWHEIAPLSEDEADAKLRSLYLS